MSGNKPRLTSFPKDSNWIEGDYGDYKFYAKLYDVGSTFGIGGGRTSKLTIQNEESCIIHYDRGWDVEPEDDFEKQILHDVVGYLEGRVHLGGGLK